MKTMEQHADPLDAAQQLTEFNADIAIKAIRAKFKPDGWQNKSGECLNCGADTPEVCVNGELAPTRWCDADCRNDYLKYDQGEE